MIRLSPNLALKAILAGAVATSQPAVAVSYTDKAVGSFVGASALTPLNGASSVVVCAAPGAGIERLVDFIAVRNSDTAPITISFYYDNGTSQFDLIRVNLQVGETLSYTHAGGWRVLTADGAVKNSTSSSVPDPNARIIATGPVTLSVDKSGSDAPGANGIGNPFLTVQALINYASRKYDFAGYPLTLSVGVGSFTECVNMKPMFGAAPDPATGAGAINLVGNGAIDQVILQADGAIALPALSVQSVPQLVVVNNITLDGSQNDWVSILNADAALMQVRNLRFLCADNSFPLTLYSAAFVDFAYGYMTTLIGAAAGCNTFASAVGHSTMRFFSGLTIQGSFAAADAFLNSNESSFISWTPQSVTGAATGARAKADWFGHIANLAGAGQAGIPGDADGTINTAHGAQLVGT